MKSFVLILGLISFATFAADEVDGQQLKIPHQDLNKAAHTIIGNYNSYSGKLECSSTNVGQETRSDNCTINLGGDTAPVENPEKIVQAVSRVQPPQGTDYHFTGVFLVLTKTVGVFVKKEIMEATLTLENIE